jgi:hypothetical protein
MTANRISERFPELQHKIRTLDLAYVSRSVELWEGADVIVCRRLDNKVKEWLDQPPLVESFQKAEPRRRAIVTDYAQEVSWLFLQIEDIFESGIDYISKYDLFASLADTANAYLDAHQNNVKLTQLLDAVLGEAKSCLDQ